MEQLVGKAYGELIILRTYRSSKGYLMCHCHCSCGKTSEVIYSNLKAGRTRSCGHLERENQESYRNLQGKIFGELMAFRKTSKRKEGTIVWECICSCGRKVEASRRQLVRGYVTSCGNHKDDALIDTRFNELTVVELSQDRKKLYCRCSCGNEAWFLKYNVLSGHTKSCGHLLKNDNFERVDGVVLATLRKKISVKNTSGYTGVSQTKAGTWVSYITFKKKRYTLGIYPNIEEAIVARADAEARFYKPILEKKSERLIEEEYHT
ncbi:AP2 domain-containing protein [Enterococcus sp. AD013-P3]|uniref:AP2 domain-containing protein n=1 Tax=Enterococcus sp. AD013-P3 TaxID=3411036 RepID=UPI003B9406D3